MGESKKRLYRFLVKMGRITKIEYKDFTGEDYEE